MTSADRLAVAGDEAAGRRVRDVAEAIDGPLDVAPDVGRDLRVAVDDPRDGRPRDAGHPGDLFEGHSASVAIALIGHSAGPSIQLALSVAGCWSALVSCESALTASSARYHRMSRERFHSCEKGAVLPAIYARWSSGNRRTKLTRSLGA